MSAREFCAMLLRIYAAGVLIGLIHTIYLYTDSEYLRLRHSRSLTSIEIFTLYFQWIFWPIYLILNVFKKYDQLRMMIYMAKITPRRIPSPR